jgi:hypothetical protein
MLARIEPVEQSEETGQTSLSQLGAELFVDRSSRSLLSFEAVRIALVDDGDGDLRTGAGGLVDLLPQLLGGFLLKDVEEVVVPYFEDLGRCRHAQGV